MPQISKPCPLIITFNQLSHIFRILSIHNYFFCICFLKPAWILAAASATSGSLRSGISSSACPLGAGSCSPGPGSCSPAPGSCSPEPGSCSPGLGCCSPAPGSWSGPGSCSPGLGSCSPGPGSCSTAPGSCSPGPGSCSPGLDFCSPGPGFCSPGPGLSDLPSDFSKFSLESFCLDKCPLKLAWIFIAAFSTSGSPKSISISSSTLGMAGCEAV